MIDINIVPIEGNVSLARDLNSMAVINTNSGNKELYLKKRKERLAEKERLATLENEVKSIKNTLETILDLLQKDKS